MPTPTDIAAALSEHGLDGWLSYDFRGSNPVFWHLVGGKVHTTRRAVLLITPDDQRLLVHRVDAAAFARVKGVPVEYYTTWQELNEWLREHVKHLKTVALEYSPMGALPVVSWVDGGTLELIRSFGVEVVSSADVFQFSATAWSRESLASHLRAMKHTVEIKDHAFAYVGDQLRAGNRCTEFDVRNVIIDEFDSRGLVTDDPPVVGVNAHSGDPHYEPTQELNEEIRRGDWLLIDLWCKEPVPEGVFADITWVAFVGNKAPLEHSEVFRVAAAARDKTVEVLAQRHSAGETVRGYELDQVGRGVIEAAGYGEFIVHRTGHSLSPGDTVHGLGVNLDDLETHDTRAVRPGVGFTVEPGIYLPEFGVRTEINVYMSDKGPQVTAPRQAEPILIMV